MSLVLILGMKMTVPMHVILCLLGHQQKHTRRPGFKFKSTFYLERSLTQRQEAAEKPVKLSPHSPSGTMEILWQPASLQVSSEHKSRNPPSSCRSVSQDTLPDSRSCRVISACYTMLYPHKHKKNWVAILAQMYNMSAIGCKHVVSNDGEYMR